MVDVRPLTAADVDAAIAVWLAANAARRHEPVSAGSAPKLRARLTDPSGFALVADDAGTVTGTGLLVPARADGGTGAPIAGLAHISLVSVAPDRWGEGIGGSIVRRLLEEARARGYTRAQLWTHNRRAERLYERMGFRATGTATLDANGERIVHYTRSI